MSDFHEEGVEAVAVDTADESMSEDQAFDTFEDALAALGDDDEGEAVETEAEEAEDAEEPGEVKVTLADGTEVSLGEIEKGYLRQADYTRKTTEIAQDRERVSQYEAALVERARSIETAHERLSEFVQGLLPPEPDAALARQNPAAYVQQKAMREQAIAELSAWMDARAQTGQAVEQLTAQQMEHQRTQANAELVKAMPKLKDAAALAKFDAEVAATAKHFGFDDATIAATNDPRVRRMAYYAAIGMRAEQNRQAASRRVEAPKPGKPAAPAQNVDRNRTAMRRLSQTGSIKDALQIDF